MSNVEQRRPSNHHPHYPNLGRRATKVTYLLAPIEGGTRATVRQEDFGHSQPAYEHAAGWERFLEWLAAYLKKAK